MSFSSRVHDTRTRFVSAATTALVALLLAGCTEPQAVEMTPPPPPELSEEEGERLIQEALDSKWAEVLSVAPGAVRPAVTRVRLVSLEEHDDVMVSCLNELGFAATLSPGGGIEYQGTSGVEESYVIAEYECTAMYPLDPIGRVPLTDEELEYIYWYWTTQLTVCLSDHGFDVPEPPSEATFKEEFVRGEGWAPYVAVANSGGVTATEFGDLKEACPEYPVDLRT